MITKCCVCGTVLRISSDPLVGGISHGYCAEHLKVVLAEITEKLEEAIDGSEGQDSSSH